MRQTVVDLASQPIKNWSWDPRATRFSILEAKQPSFWSNRYGTFSAYSLVTGAADGPQGISTYARMATTGTLSGLGFHLAENPEVGSPVASVLAPATAGETVTLSLWVRSSVAVTINFTIRPATSSGTWVSAQSSIGTPLSAGVWQRLVRTFTVPAGATGLASYVVFSGTVPIGTTLDVTGMVYTRDGIHPAGFVDGDSPGWRWLGTARVSPSVGYPYTLESIAGSPLASLSTPGGQVASLGLAGTEGRTLYLVHDVIDTASALAPLASIGLTGTAGAGTFLMRTGAAAGDRVEARCQTISGAASFATDIGGRTVGRRVSVATAAEGAASATMTVDGRTPVTTAVDPAGGWSTGTNNKLFMAATTASDAPILALAYRGEHDLETRRRVVAWLARRYGGTIPAGY